MLLVGVALNRQQNSHQVNIKVELIPCFTGALSCNLNILAQRQLGQFGNEKVELAKVIAQRVSQWDGATIAVASAGDGE